MVCLLRGQEVARDSVLVGAAVTLPWPGLQVDLCHGPHLPNTGYLKASAVGAFNRAFWRADVNKEHLQVRPGKALCSALCCRREGTSYSNVPKRAGPCFEGQRGLAPMLLCIFLCVTMVRMECALRCLYCPRTCAAGAATSPGPGQF